MLRFALRRLLWVAPSLLLVSVLTFAIVSRIPFDTDAKGLYDSSRSRFAELPLFLNAEPGDVRSQVRGWLDALERRADEPARAAEARRALARLGGAALPTLFAQWDRMKPALRTEVALALAPVADRMALD
ncbi:MAG: ABC transporter permease, partial [Myxococcota bacterium]